MHQVKRQAERDIGKPPQDKDTRDYPVGGRKPVTKPRKSDREPEPPLPPEEGPPSAPPVGAGGGGEPPEGDDPSDPDDSELDESDDEESDNTEATEESGFLYDEKGRKIDIEQFYEAIRKRKKRTTKEEDEIPFKVVRGPRGHRGSKGRKGPPGDSGMPQSLDRSVDANVTIDTAGLEKTFREMGDSMRDVFTSQQIFNRTMKDTLEATTKAQEKQTEALEKLNISTKQRDHDHMFAAIKPYDGKDAKEFDAWIEQIMTACKISGRNPKFVALAKSTGAVTEVILSMNPKVTWVEFVEELRRCFSDSKTRVHAAAIYNEFRRQDDNENLRSYIHKYTRLHREATGKATDEEFDTHNKLHFLSRLRNRTIATKISQSEEFKKFDKYSLKNCIEKALMLESRLQIREMVTIARENLENKEPKVLEMTEEGEEQQEELNILSEDKGPGRFRNPNLANLICYKCGGYGHYGRECPEANQAMEQLEDRIVGRIEHSFNAYTPVSLQYMNDMIVKAAKLEVSRKLAKKKLEKLKNQKGGDPQDKTQCPVGRGRGLGTTWMEEGKFALQKGDDILVESIEVFFEDTYPKLKAMKCMDIQARSIVVITTKADFQIQDQGKIFEGKPVEEFTINHPNLITLPIVHKTDTENRENVPYMLINLSNDDEHILKGEEIAIMEELMVNSDQIYKEADKQENKEQLKSDLKVRKDEIHFEEEINYMDDEIVISVGESDEEDEVEEKFITSPADVETQRKVKLQNANITEIDKARFRCLCNEFEDIFSKSSEDIGHTPLVTMDIETGDSPPVCQKPYSLPLKHVEWVQKELEILERAGVIQRSMSPWASPIVIVPKKTEPGEPPRRRMCVDYRMLNSLLPPVNKAHSKAKGIVTLVPLPKIDEIYAQLQGSKIF